MRFLDSLHRAWRWVARTTACEEVAHRRRVAEARLVEVENHRRMVRDVLDRRP